ncbi:hypothetical protein ACFL6Y_10085 [Elusimicrobiota bacterium]
MKKITLVALMTLILSGCLGGKYKQFRIQLAEAIREKASIDFKCPLEQVGVVMNDADHQHEAKGCDKNDKYTATCAGLNVETQCNIHSAKAAAAAQESEGAKEGDSAAVPGDPAIRPVKKPAGTRGSFLFFTQGEPLKKPPEGWEDLKVLESGSADDYRIIGIVEATGRGLNLTQESMIPELKKQASMLGADAINNIESNKFNTFGEAVYATAIALEVLK